MNNSAITFSDDNCFASDDFHNRAVKYQKMYLEVALLDALDGVTFPKSEEPGSQIMLTCSSSTLS